MREWSSNGAESANFKKGTMRDKKIKIEQYLVRGKHRDFPVLVFPKKSLIWAYFEHFDGRYEIDCDQESAQFLKYALAALIADPRKIVYFPIRGEGLGGYYRENYDAVLTRPEAQLRRSEWVRLRRQLNQAHRVENFVLWYRPEKLCAACGENDQTLYARAGKREKQEVNTLCGDTVFMTLLEESCCLYHRSIVETEQEHHRDPESCTPFGSGVNGNLGWLIHHRVKKEMLRQSREHIGNEQVLL